MLAVLLVVFAGHVVLDGAGNRVALCFNIAFWVGRPLGPFHAPVGPAPQIAGFWAVKRFNGACRRFCPLDYIVCDCSWDFGEIVWQRVPRDRWWQYEGQLEVGRQYAAIIMLFGNNIRRLLQINWAIVRKLGDLPISWGYLWIKFGPLRLQEFGIIIGRHFLDLYLFVLRWILILPDEIRLNTLYCRWCYEYPKHTVSPCEIY